MILTSWDMQVDFPETRGFPLLNHHLTCQLGCAWLKKQAWMAWYLNMLEKNCLPSSPTSLPMLVCPGGALVSQSRCNLTRFHGLGLTGILEDRNPFSYHWRVGLPGILRMEENIPGPSKGCQMVAKGGNSRSFRFLLGTPWKVLVKKKDTYIHMTFLYV